MTGASLGYGGTHLIDRAEAAFADAIAASAVGKQLLHLSRVKLIGDHRLS